MAAPAKINIKERCIPVTISFLYIFALTKYITAVIAAMNHNTKNQALLYM